ncbi:hypothetical protein [Collimonas sp. OK412]|jgi:hypothetical protein|uniref:hypothetical protein n=1 Tax=Collimonas sp. (strain OK412) TaxID=1801619 RepID=UPI0008E06AB6|nr:hypothetical protein [Collimonas sp. OK412]SFB80536.1 hypothetical protein SAMN04515619_10237 [Collimonas sp. OK412]
MLRGGFLRGAAGGACLLAIAVALSGCNSIGGFAGAAAGVASGAVTSNPAVGYAIGIGVQAATDATTKYVFRNWQKAEQDEIAAIVGQLDVGQARKWAIVHQIAYGNEHGEVRVTRLIDTPLALCKEVLLSVDSGTGVELKRAWYTASACRSDDVWKWAVAEPAVERWGSLQ